jgi:hypothetical protein
MRASDDDRSRVADELRGHCTAGRITIDELDERVGRAMSAVTLGDLAALTADLPASVSPPAVSALTGKPTVEVAVAAGGAGVRPFTMRVVVPAPPEHTRAVALQTIAPGLNGQGFEMSGQTPTQLNFRKDGNKVLPIVLAVMFFPFGLIALRFSRDERVTISLEPESANRTALIIHGKASSKVRRGFAELTF